VQTNEHTWTAVHEDGTTITDPKVLAGVIASRPELAHSPIKTIRFQPVWSDHAVVEVHVPEGYLPRVYRQVTAYADGPDAGKPAFARQVVHLMSPRGKGDLYVLVEGSNVWVAPTPDF
jgi:hypothetical protein